MSKITKLGLGIIAFEGTEHIANIIYEVKEFCDEIVVCLQETSYHGDPIDEKDIDNIINLKNLGYVDDVIWFVPSNLYPEEPVAGPRMVETDKRNFILDFLQNERQCSHSMVIDSDEFYDRTDFKKAKDIINADDNIHVAYCQYINYYRDYQHLLLWPYQCYVPFITESQYRFDFKYGSFDKASDPTRRYFIDGENKVYHIIPYNIVKMHHLSWIRKDIEKKLDGWSAKRYFSNIQGLREAILERYYNYQDGQNAIIMFNVPMYQVVVNKLPKQYIHPHFNLLDDITEYKLEHK
jgi:hypothetical protein